MTKQVVGNRKGNGTALNERELEFAVFCIENVAEKLEIPGNRVYEMLSEDSGILDHCVIENYEILHTQGKEYIVGDIIDYMKEQGVME